MHKLHFSSIRRTAGASHLRWHHIVALALVLAFTVPASAAEDRAVKSRVSPAYPELAKRMKIEGTVKIEATVDPGGKVTAVKTLSGSRALAPAAEEAVSKWKYAASDGTSTVQVEVTFALSQ